MEPDEKVGLKSAVGYERGSTGLRLERKNTLADEGRNVQQMDPKAQKLISNYAKNFKDRFRKKKADSAAKKAAEPEEDTNKEAPATVDESLAKEVEKPKVEEVKM